MESVIKRPIITEKATHDSENNNRFSFVVKREAKKAVERLYGVTVESVRTMNYGGGKPSLKYTNKGIVRQSNGVWKKAIVTVAAGETIDLFNNI